jgi:OPT family oligopeptide transporter
MTNSSHELKQLTEEQVRTWTLEEKDRWWLDNVYQGDQVPQLTLRAALTGMILGGVLSLTNLYVGIRTGWTLGVGITSVTLSFAIFKLLAKLKIGKEMGVLENNAMQSIATSAGYMTAPLIASMPAYMLVTNQVIPAFHTWIWIVMLSLLGVLFAFPLKKRFINEEQLPFPEGYAAGVVMHNLHTGEGKEGLFKAKVLLSGAGVASLIESLRSEKLMAALRTPFLQLPEYYDEFIYKFFTPKILGTPLKDLTIRMDTSLVMVAAGGLMGIKTAFSLIVGAFLNYFVLAPWLIQTGVIPQANFKNITMWALWGGVAMMTTSSLFSFFSKPKMLLQSFKFKKSTQTGTSASDTQEDLLKNIELPMWIFAVGIPIVGAATVLLGHFLFGIHYWLGILAIPLVFVFTLIAVNSTGLTSITPGGALGKLTQLTFSVLAPGNIPTNIMTAGITGEVSLNASNLLMDIKPGYMLGAKPRQQAIGHVLGVFAGAAVAVPVFYLIFDGDISRFTSEKLPMPSVQIWRSVAEVLTKGLSFLHPSAQAAVAIGAVLGVVFEILGKRTKGRFPLTGVGMGLAFVLKFTDSLSMALGAFVFWFLGRMTLKETSATKRIFVDNQETLCAGMIAGGSIIGIILILLETFILK